MIRIYIIWYNILTNVNVDLVVIKKIKYQNNLKQLIFFYKEHYSKTIIDNEILYYDKLSYILAYKVIDMTTNKIIIFKNIL